MVSNEEKRQIDSFLKEFKKTKQKGEFRNKIGRVLWPVYRKGVAPALLGLMVVGIAANPAAWPAAAVFGGIVAASLPITSGYTKYLKNISLSNAAILGRTLKKQTFSEAGRQYAMEQYLKQNMPLFTAQKYIQQNPDMVARLREGLPVQKENSFVANMEHNINQAINRGPVDFKRRMQIYKETWQQTQANRQALEAAKNPSAETAKPLTQTIQKDR